MARGSNNPNRGGSSDSNDTDSCPYCSVGQADRCPYWYKGIDGNWYHDSSGGAGTMDHVIMGDSYGIGGELPRTPMPGQDDDDDRGSSKEKKRGWR